MTGPANRLKRIARKYAIDRGLAQRALAKTERQRNALAQTRTDLERAGARLSAGCGEVRSLDLAAASEWQGRLAIATGQVDEALVRIDSEAQAQRAAALRANGRVDLIDRRLNELRQQDDRKPDEAPARRAVRSSGLC